MDIVVIGYAGLSGSLEIYRLKRREIRALYNGRFLRPFEEGTTSLPAEDILEEPLKKGLISYIESADEGGVMSALWKVLEKAKKGCEYSRRRIPVLQQTVEICELYGIDPYKLSSKGCFVCLCNNGRELSAYLESSCHGCIPSVYIGRTDGTKARKRTDGEEIAFLRRPEPDELIRFKEKNTDISVSV